MSRSVVGRHLSSRRRGRFTCRVVSMTKLELTRRRYAESIRELLWQRHRLRLSGRLVSAFGQIPREKFLGPPPWLIRGLPATTVCQRVMLRLTRQHVGDWTTRDPSQLYRDVAVAIDPGRGLNNGQPRGVATWLHLLELRSGDRVLHVGCGLGYYTAVVTAAVAPGEVIGVELDAALASQARANLGDVNHVTIVDANGVEYDSGPVDVILVNAGATHPPAARQPSRRRTNATSLDRRAGERVDAQGDP